MSDETFKIGHRVRIKGISSCAGKEGEIEKVTTVPPDNRESYLVNLGDGLMGVRQRDRAHLEDVMAQVDYRELTDDDVLVLGDETARTSLLNSRENYEGWNYIEAEAAGPTVRDYKRNDMDAAERVFRRRLPKNRFGPFRITAHTAEVRAELGKIGPFLRGKQTIEMVFTVQRNAPNRNGDTFDLPYEIVDEKGEIVGHGVFEDCTIKHVTMGELDGDVMKAEPVSALCDRVLPFKVE